MANTPFLIVITRPGHNPRRVPCPAGASFQCVKLCPPCQPHSSLHPGVPDTHLTQNSWPSTSGLVPFHPAPSARSEWLHTIIHSLLWHLMDAVCTRDSSAHMISLVRVRTLGCRHQLQDHHLPTIDLTKGKGPHVSAGEGSTHGYLEMCNNGS